jgi:hypothetical protein
MTSPIDRLHKRTAAAAVLWLHGDDEENVVRWIGGASDNTVALRGIFYPAETMREEGRGIDFVTEDILELAGTVTVAENDKFEIDGEVYKVLAVGKVVGGIREITLKQTKQQVRRSQRDII